MIGDQLTYLEVPFYTKINDDKLITVDTSNTEGGLGAWTSGFGMKVPMRQIRTTEEKGNNADKLDLEEEESRTEQAVSPEVRKTQIKWNKEGYGKGSRGTKILIVVTYLKIKNPRVGWTRSVDGGRKKKKER